MIVKSFTADTFAGALKMVRSELGGDAVILKSRKIGSGQSAVGGRVEITACVDKNSKSSLALPVDATEPQLVARSRQFPADAIVQKLDFLIDIFQTPVRRSTFSGTVGQVFLFLLHADIPEAMAHDLARRLEAKFDAEDDYGIIATAAAQMLHEQLPRSRGSKEMKPGQRIAFVGPAGSGKTSLMGRLAGSLVCERKQAVCLTSLDKVKVSAPEELITYADILDVDRLEMPGEVDNSLLESHGKDKVIMIDTPALNTRDREEIKLYAEKLIRLKPHRIIGVFPATLRTSDLYDMIRAYKPLKLTELAITMCDQTSRLGGMIAVSIQTGLPITTLGIGRKAGCIELNPDHRQIIDVFLSTGEVIDNE